MRVKHEVLSPGVQDSHEADPGAEVPAISGNRQQCLRSSPEKNAVNDALVLKRDRSKHLRKGKDDVEVLDWQEFCLAGLEPLGLDQGLALGTVTIAARVVGEPFVPASVTLVPVAAQCGGPAKFDGAHDTSLARQQGRTMDFPVLRTVAAEDVRHLE
jgi:hypothetical protein